MVKLERIELRFELRCQVGFELFKAFKIRPVVVFRRVRRLRIRLETRSNKPGQSVACGNMGDDAARAIDRGGREDGLRGVGMVAPSHLTSNAIQRGELVQLKLSLWVIDLQLFQQG